jgi:hypothetical protein
MGIFDPFLIPASAISRNHHQVEQHADSSGYVMELEAGGHHPPTVPRLAIVHRSVSADSLPQHLVTAAAPPFIDGTDDGMLPVDPAAGAVEIRAAGLKSSFYVWFLGCVETRRLWGKECIADAVEPVLVPASIPAPAASKVTLQISAKGVKMVHVVPVTSSRSPDCGTCRVISCNIG